MRKFSYGDASFDLCLYTFAKKYTHHHKMGTAGYAGMSLVWDKEDEDYVSRGLPKPFGKIKDKRTRAWARARATCSAETGFVPTILDP